MSTVDENKNSGTKSYVDTIKENYPGYLHYLYRYANYTQGQKSSHTVTDVGMNKKSEVVTEQRNLLNLSHIQVNN